MGTAVDGLASRHTFPRSHRLKEHRLIRALFDRSRNDTGTLAQGTIRLVYRVVPRADVKVPAPLKVGVAPGRGLRRAVDRNRVKRHMREAYRHQQHALRHLFEARGDTLTLMILYRGGLPLDPPRIQRDTARAVTRLAERLTASTSDAGT